MRRFFKILVKGVPVCRFFLLFFVDTRTFVFGCHAARLLLILLIRFRGHVFTNQFLEVVFDSGELGFHVLKEGFAGIGVDCL